jgi:hypothetical protein
MSNVHDDRFDGKRIYEYMATGQAIYEIRRMADLPEITPEVDGKIRLDGAEMFSPLSLGHLQYLSSHSRGPN